MVVYLDVNVYFDLWIKVFKKKQWVYLIDNGKILYMMYCLIGIGKNDMLIGIYYIQVEWGIYFYS